MSKEVFKKDIYLEWGSWMAYVPISAQVDVDWSGKVLVRHGRLSNPMFIEFKGIYGALHEDRIPMLRPEWDWRNIQARLNARRRMTGGFVCTVEGPGDCEIVIDTKALTASFRLKEIIRKKELIFHVGDKYSCKDLIVRLDGYNPFRLQKEDVAERARRDNVWQELFLPEDIERPAAVRQWFRMNTAWIKDRQEVKVHFNMDEHLRERRIRLSGRIQTTAAVWADAAANDPRFIEEKSQTASIPFIMRCNGQIIWKGRRTFSHVRNIPLLEEIEFEIGPQYLKGRNVLTIEHYNPSAYLILVYLLLNEKTALPEPLHKIDILPANPDPVYVGIDSVLIPPAGVAKVLGYMHRTQLGNFMYYRFVDPRFAEQDPRGNPARLAEQWARTMKKHSMACAYFSYAPPKIVSRMKQIMGPLCLGQLYQECDGDLWGYKRLAEEQLTPHDFQVNNRTMRAAEQNYVLSLKWWYREVLDYKGKVPIIATFSAVGNRHGYKAGMSLAEVQLNKSHNLLLLADARGAAKEAGKRIWGCHISEGAHKNPTGKEMLRMWWLSLYVAYFSGASVIYDEESVWRNWHEHIYSQNDYIPKMRQDILRTFYRFTKYHARKGKKKVDFALMQGKYSCDCADGLLCSMTSAEPPKVWGTFGARDDSWNYKEAEYGYQLADLFYPYAWTQSLVQKPDKIRHWWTGTPYGEFDFISADAPASLLRQYKFIVIPGWNTMTAPLYHKIKTYIKNGGELFLSVPQLSTHISRSFLDSMEDLALINSGDVADLCGVRVDGKGPEVDKIIINRHSGWEANIDKAYALQGDCGRGHSKIHLAKIRSRGADIIAYDHGTKQPVLVEHKIDQGKLYLLTTYNYQGNVRMRKFVTDFLRSKVESHLAPFKISGDTEEIYYAAYTEAAEGIVRLYFINTDWTSDHNIKHFRIEYHGASINCSVKERFLKSVIISDPLVIEHEEQFLFISRIKQENSQLRISAVGEGVKKLSYRFLDRPNISREHTLVFDDSHETDFFLKG